MNLGYARGEMGFRRAALAAYERVLTLRPDNADVWTLKASALRGLGREAEDQEAERRQKELGG